MVDEAPKDGSVPAPSDKVLDVRVRLPGGLHTKEAIEGRHARLERSEPVDSRSDLPVTVSIPSIKGEVMQRLRESPPREDDADLRFEGYERFELDGKAEVGVAAIALVLLENIGRHGGSKVSLSTVRTLLDRLLPTLSPRELMALDGEVYRTIQWVGESIDPAMDDVEPVLAERMGPESHLDLIERAMRDQFDLDMEYFTGARTELNRRRITPHSVDAERYLHAYCHQRQHDRVFRLSRISNLWPASGYVPAAPAGNMPPAPAGNMPPAPAGHMPHAPAGHMPHAPAASEPRQTKDPGSQLSLLQEEDKDT